MGEFFPKIFFGIFLYTLGRRDYPPILGIKGGGKGGGIHAQTSGRGNGGLYGRGYNENPHYKRWGGVLLSHYESIDF